MNFIYYYGKILGLCPLTLDHENEFKFSYSCIIYAVVISIVYSLIFYWAMEMKYKTFLPGQTLAAVVVDGNVHILQLCTMIFSWLIFAFRQKKLQKIIKNIKRTGEMENKLGLLDEKEEIVQTLVIRTLLVTSYFGVTCLIDQIFYSRMKMYNPLIWIPYRLSHVVIHYIFLLFITALNIIQQRFSRLNFAFKKLSINSCREKNSKRRLGLQNTFFIYMII